MTVTYYAHVLANGKEIWGALDLNTNTIQEIKPTYLEENFVLTNNIIKLPEDTKFLVPTKPTKIICLGLNYVDHAIELKMEIPKTPIIFIKPTSALIGHKDNIIYPEMTKQVDYEGELAIVIKKTAKCVRPENAQEYILGYTCFNDVTARDLQKIDGQWTRAKSFDTFAPVGPWIVDGIDPHNLRIQTFLNGKIVQDSNTKNMIFTVQYVVSFVSSIMTLYPGDIISLGTPPGVGELKRGDTVTVKIEKIGELTNYVV